MYDPRLDTLADLLIKHSIHLQHGEKILIETFDIPEDMIIALIRAARNVGGVPLVSYKQNRIQRELIQAGQEEAMQIIGECETYRMERVQAYIGMRGSRNIAEMSDVPSDRMQLYQTHWLQPVHFQERVPNTRWVVLRWPSPSMAPSPSSAPLQSSRSASITWRARALSCVLAYAKNSDIILYNTV